MRLNEYISTINFPLLKMTVAYLVDGDRVLLGKKIKIGGLGEGKYMGIGGKLEEGEDFDQSIKREIEEEIGVKAVALKDMGTVHFYTPSQENKLKSNVQVRIYICQNWQRDPKPSNEMVPEWFDKDKIPYEKMWDDNKYWVPSVLADKRIEAHFMFNPESELIEEYNIRFI